MRCWYYRLCDDRIGKITPPASGALFTVPKGTRPKGSGVERPGASYTGGGISDAPSRRGAAVGDEAEAAARTITGQTGNSPSVRLDVVAQGTAVQFRPAPSLLR